MSPSSRDRRSLRPTVIPMMLLALLVVSGPTFTGRIGRSTLLVDAAPAAVILVPLIIEVVIDIAADAAIDAAIDAAVEETVEVGVVDAETGALTGDTVSTVISTASKVHTAYEIADAINQLNTVCGTIETPVQDQTLAQQGWTGVSNTLIIAENGPDPVGNPQFAARLVHMQGAPTNVVFPQCLSGDNETCYVLSSTEDISDTCFLLGTDGNCNFNSCPSVCMPTMIGLGPPVACGPIIENPANFPPSKTTASPAWSASSCANDNSNIYFACPAGAAWDICNAMMTLTTLGWTSATTSGGTSAASGPTNAVVAARVIQDPASGEYYPQVATYMAGLTDFIVPMSPQMNANNIDFVDANGFVNPMGTVVTPSPCQFPYNGTNQPGCVVPTSLPLTCSETLNFLVNIDIFGCTPQYCSPTLNGLPATQPCCPSTAVYPAGSPLAGQNVLYPNPQAAVCQCPPPELQPMDNSLSCPNPTRGPVQFTNSLNFVLDCPGCCGPIDYVQLGSDICNSVPWQASASPAKAESFFSSASRRKILSSVEGVQKQASKAKKSSSQQQRVAQVDLREGFVTIDKIRILPSFMNKLPKNMSIYRSSKVLLSKLRSTLLDDKLITAQVVEGDSTTLKGDLINAFLKPGGKLMLYSDSRLTPTSNYRLGHYLSSDLYNDNKTGLIRAGPSSELVALPFCPIANGNVVHMRWKIANFTDMSRQIAGKMYRPAVDNLLLEAMVGSVEISSTIAKIEAVKRASRRDHDYRVLLGAQ